MANLIIIVNIKGLVAFIFNIKNMNTKLLYFLLFIESLYHINVIIIVILLN